MFFSWFVLQADELIQAGDRDSYQYLVESIRRFPPQQEFATMLRDAGLVEVEFTDLTFGVAAIHSGFKLLQ